MLKIRRSHDRLIFNMGIPIPGKTVFILRRGPEGLNQSTVLAVTTFRNVMSLKAL